MTIEAHLADGRVLEFPDGTDPAVIQRTVKTTLGVQPPAEPERSTAGEVLRKTELFSRGLLERGAELATAPADLIWKGAEALGLPTPGVSAADTLKSGLRAVGNAMNSVVQPFLPDMGPAAPESQGDKLAYGAGQGVADAGSVLVPGGAAARFGRAGGVVQRAGQAASTQPVLQAASGAAAGGTTAVTDDPLAGALAGLAVPAGAAAARRVITPVGNQLNAEQQRLARVAGQEGVPLSPAQRSGSRVLRTTESVFGTLPLTAGPQNVKQQAQNSAFNRAVLSRAGISGDSATPDILDAARQRLGASFERLASQTTVNLDQQFQTEVTGIVNRFANRLEPQRRPIFEQFVKEIMGSGGPPAPMNGALYQTVRSDLGTIAKNVAANDHTLANALRGLRDALDDAAERSMPPALRGEWRETRRQYGNLRVIEKAMSGTTVAAGSGNIPPTAFAQAVRQQHPRAYGFGAGEMNDLSRVGTQFVRDPIPNSGTPERSFIINMLTGGAGGAAASGADLGTTVGGMATALLGPRLAQLAYYSRPAQAYLNNRLAQNGPALSPELIAAILAAQGIGQSTTPTP